MKSEATPGYSTETTVKPVEPEMLPELAESVPNPSPSGEKTPVCEMLPTARPLVIAQWQEFVMFCVLPSLKWPVAVYCTLLPNRFTMMLFAGVTVIDCSTALVTVKARVPVTPPKLARALKLPVVSPVATPVALTTPTAGPCDDHVTWLVMFWVTAWVLRRSRLPSVDRALRPPVSR